MDKDEHTPGFRFRLRFRMAKLIDSKLQETKITATGLSQLATMTSEIKNRPFNEGNWLVIQSRGYLSKKAASDSGQMLKDTLLLAGAEQKTGVDVGIDRATSSLTKFVKDNFAAKSGLLLRDDIFGLDVFEDVEAKILQGQLKILAPANLEYFLKAIQDLAPLAMFMDDRSRVSAQLINDALFSLTPETRLLILMTSIESLWDRPRRSESIVALASALSICLHTLSGSADDKEDVAKRVDDIRVQSISRMCKDKITDLLGVDRAKEFAYLYAVRSGFVHDGKGRAQLHSEGDLAQRLAFDVLIAELRNRNSVNQ